MNEWLQVFVEQVKETGWLQWLGLILGVCEVLLARANKTALYPTGIVASAITIYLFWNAGLFAESFLNSYYVLMSIYGWWHWITGKNEEPVKISYTLKKEWIIVACIVGVGYILLYYILNEFTHSNVPHWDAWVTSTAWAGMWLLAKRKVENWVLLNISNAFAVPLLFHKQLPLYAFLTIFLFVVAVQGYFAWKKKVGHAG